MRKPLIGISADRRLLGLHPFHCVGEKYITAVTEGGGALAVLLPALGAGQAQSILPGLDGLLLTGSPSNVEPHHYQGPASEPGTLHDAARDATTLPLVKQAVELGIPLLAICRGFQEMNVAYGGTLHQRVQEVPGYMDHREDPQASLDVQYGPAHDVTLAPGGQFQQLAGSDRLTVNSLHAQGVQRLGAGLSIEARAPDGLIEAFRVTAAPAFAVGVQWHPEWRFQDNPFSCALFAAFGAAAARRAQLTRSGGSV